MTQPRMVRDENYASSLDADHDSDSMNAASLTAADRLVVERTGGYAEEDSDTSDPFDTVDLAESADNTESADLADTADLAESFETVETVASGAAQQEVSDSLAEPFVGRWNRLISSTNWEKGRIISQWRAALIEAGAGVTEFSDEAWAKHVGGVTASHVGRLRRVYDVFGASYETYPRLYWTHFLVALDWDDAPLWLEGAAQSGWSVSQMRAQRWEAIGGDEGGQPTETEASLSDVDEDFDSTLVAPANATRTPEFTQPGQGGGSTKEYGDGPAAVAGPATEGPDFGDEESLNRLSDNFHDTAAPGQTPHDASAETAPPLVQPFAGLPELPSDLADAVELLKLAVLRHKTAGWKDVNADVVTQYLKAFHVLVEARGR